jgi:DNA repair protein RecN (Recombination protein N)
MLTFLGIKNLAIADNISLELKKGFNVLTGETGAGKSIIVDSVGLLAGARAYKELIRTGKERAVVEGIFENISDKVIAYLKEQGIECDKHQLTIKREILKNGKNRIFINGETAPLFVLEHAGKMLIQIHSQNDQQMLLVSENHIKFLDDFGNYKSQLNKVAKAYNSVEHAKKAYKSLIISEQEKNRKIDLLKFQIDEIENLALKEGEIEELLSQKEIIKQTEKIKSSAYKCDAVLNSEGDSLIEKLYDLFKETTKISEIKKEFCEYASSLETACASLKELEEDIAAILVSMTDDENSIDNLENRLFEIEKIQKKYGESEQDIFKHLEKCKKELSTLEELELKLKEAFNDLKKAHELYIEECNTLTNIRKKQAKLFEEKLQKELSELSMKNITVVFHITQKVKDTKNHENLLSFPHSENGLDNVEILISPNIGEEVKPLVKIASGGEISRIMLAIKILTKENKVSPTSVFDEIDTGIGGDTALSLATKLKQLSSDRQVICVTHLPQIASKASAHYAIEKIVIEGRTKTVVKFLTKESRREEIARMLSGNNITENALNHASELLGG